MKEPIRLGLVCFCTKRLTVRNMCMDDVDGIHAFYSLPGALEGGGIRSHQSIRETIDMVAYFCRRERGLVICHGEEIVGTITVSNSRWASEDDVYGDKIVMEFGFVIAKSHWGKGFATEAVSGLIDFLHQENFEFDALSCTHFDDNLASKRVIEKCGFEFFKHDIYWSRSLARYFDDNCYIMPRRQS